MASHSSPAPFVPPPTPITRIVRPFRAFAAKPVAGALLLVGAALLAILWANSPWGDDYRAFLDTKFTVGVGEFALSKPLILWINDGLMAVFFFLVGLEIKREVLDRGTPEPRAPTGPSAAS